MIVSLLRCGFVLVALLACAQSLAPKDEQHGKRTPSSNKQSPAPKVAVNPKKTPSAQHTKRRPAASPKHGKRPNSAGQRVAGREDVKVVMRPSEQTPLPQPGAFKIASGQNQCKSRVMVMVPSDVRQAWKRTALRNSWAQAYRDVSPDDFRFFFLVGQLWNSTPPAVVSEAREYGDMLLVASDDFDFADYTRKVVLGMKAAGDRCKFDFFLKVTEFSFVNPYTLRKWLDAVPAQGTFRGRVVKGAVPQRDPHSPWYISPARYERNRFPAYTQSVYLLSRDVFNKAAQIDGRYLDVYYDDAALAVWLYDMGIHPTHDEGIVLRPNCGAPVLIELNMDELDSYGENMRERSNHVQCY